MTDIIVAQLPTTKTVNTMIEKVEEKDTAVNKENI